jgi:hypothetical protein
MKSKVNGDDYMKYWRVVRKWAYIKYGLSVPKLEMLLFLYSEGKFSKTQFDEYKQIFSFDTKWFERLREQGYIVKWRNQRNGEKALYCLSVQAIGIIKSIYRKLNGEEAFSEHRDLFKLENPRYRDKVLRNQMKKINQELRQRPSQG